MFGQPFVDERVIGREQIDHAAIFVHDAVEEQLRLAPERLPQGAVEVREQIHDRFHRRHPAYVQPLPREVFDQRLRSWIRDHAPDLLLEHGGIPELSLGGQPRQLVVGNAAP